MASVQAECVAFTHVLTVSSAYRVAVLLAADLQKIYGAQVRVEGFTDAHSVNLCIICRAVDHRDIEQWLRGATLGVCIGRLADNARYNVETDSFV